MGKKRFTKLITDSGSITANKVVVATNGYTDESLHPSFANRMMPVLSNIIVTREMSKMSLNYKTIKLLIQSATLERSCITIEECLQTGCYLEQEATPTAMKRAQRECKNL